MSPRLTFGRAAAGAAKKLMAVAAATALLTATACSSGGSGDDGGDAKTVHLALAQDVDTLLPMDSNVGDNIGVLDVVYDGLVRYDPKTTKPYNYVASDITNKGNKVWTIKIKDGLKFQNGEPVDAEAFIRAWNYAAYGPNAMANNYFFERIAGYDDMQGDYDEDEETGKVTVNEEPKAKELSGLKAVDDHTLQVTLTGPFAGFSTMLGYTGFFPIAKACLDDIKACATKPIGNGPFQVEKWDQGTSLTANKWKGYTLKETPNFDKIQWTEYGGNSAWPDFQAGDLDTGAPPPSEWAAANNDPDLSSRKVEGPGAALTYLGFPLYRKGPWTDVEFRKAISMAIDRKKIIDEVLPGQATPATSWVAPDAVPGGKAGTCEWCSYDPAAAKAALKKAGGWPKGKVLPIYLGKDDTQEEYFKAIGDQISLNLGIKYKLEPSTDFFDQRSARKFNGAYRNNWFPDYPLNENYLAPVYASGDAKNGNTNFGFYSKAFEDKIAEGDKSADLDSAVVKYSEAEAILAQEFPTVPLSFSKNVTFYSDRVDNVVLDPFSGATKLRLLKYVG
ncbi:peptide ABC transporter substrate-binding protein [Microlunatus soli]|uniref:Oligopeptide transport system substrate-binding protein n=1 Tax=Microlunatus soli TaxID=630515 RepID=A0A1H1WGN9_9ACTN|nr:ABC transporter substrate-binding protein [Microlunatus soli]SDS96202.1 oligopeptide transport system substrate-binding protein [Microlunatus soli]